MSQERGEMQVPYADMPVRPAPVRRLRGRGALAALSTAVVLATGCSSGGGDVGAQPLPSQLVPTEAAPWPADPDLTVEATPTPTEQATPTEAAPATSSPEIDETQSGPFAAVYYQPYASSIANPGQTLPNVYKMVAEPGKSNSWTSTERCGRENADNFLQQPGATDVTAIIGFSLGRLGLPYLLSQTTPQQQRQFNYAFIVDPGNAADFTDSCDKPEDSTYISTWLHLNRSNRLVIMAGEQTAQGDHQALYEKYISSIAGTGVEDQVIICSNSELGHQQVWDRSVDALKDIGDPERRITSPKQCPAGFGGFYPER